MEECGLYTDCNTYFWLLEGCLKYGSLVDAKRVHGRILKSGFGGDSGLANRLVDAFIGFGNLDDAIRVVNEMSQRNVTSWNYIIAAFLVKKMNHRVLGFFRRMLECTQLDGHAFACDLRACDGSNASFSYIEQIHAQIFRHGFFTEPIIGNALIYLNSKYGDVDSAALVFGELCSRDSVSWVAMISSLSQNSHGEKALILFCKMQRLGIIPTPYVFSSVLSACAKTELFENGKQLQAQVFKWGFHFVGNALVTLYSRHGNLGLTKKVFAEMHRHDKVTNSSLIYGHTQCGNSHTTFHFYRKMQLAGLKPDVVTIASRFSACASAGDLDKGRHLNSHVTKARHSSNIIIEGSLLDLYVKCVDIETAHEFFNTINRQNVVLWNAMLVAYGHMGALDLGEQIHSQIIKTGFEQNIYVCSVLIDMYTKCGRLSIAREFLERLTEEDVVSWTIMIAGYAQHEFFVEALRLFEEMQSIGIRPDNIGFSSALSACAGIQVLKQGLQIHAQAVVAGYSMDLSLGNSLVSLYARCGIIKEAYSAFEMIETKDEISWNRLILRFAQSGHCEEALQVFAKMNRECVRANLFTFGFAISASANIAEIKQGKQNHGRMIKTSYDSVIEASNVLITLYSKCGNIDGANREFYEMLERNEVSWNAMITGYSQHGFGIEALSR
ncbi:hypothetical protein MRB53_024085 [Persea americana]|uniref:Uncharacterized protein n=1 Tax=Persea americana TaxID=3435 RepID=A0ACC2LB70_PERAE|nr:hypothetical protein MRB53_024085 [Persea americana]